MYCKSGLGLGVLLGACLASISCNRVPPPVAGKIAVLRFENLSPDASLDWVGRALSEIVGKELGAHSFAAIARAQQPYTPHPVAAPGISSEKSAALLTGATDTITGYFTVANGKLAVTAVEENLATGKAVRSLSATGDVFSAADSIARAFTANPKPVPTHNQDAIRLYASGLENGGPDAMKDFAQAVADDPAFGDAYLAWAGAAAARNDRAELERALAAGNAHSGSLPPLDRALLNLESATLRQDTPARIEALSTIVKLSPGNRLQLRALADAEVGAHRFAPAVGHYEEVIALAPGDTDTRNLLAYAKMFAGDYTGALNAVREYRKLKPQDPNALDSEGDIHFYFGKFEDAERLYLQAFALNPDFQAGMDRWKAARARLMTADVPGSAKLFQDYHDARAKAGDPTLGFRDAEWRYLTGERDEAIPMMIAAGEGATHPEVRALCYGQTAVWEVLAGRPREAIGHSALALRPGNGATLVNVVIANFLAQPAGSAAEWRERAEREINGNGAGKIRELALAYAYLLSRDFSDAVPAWKEVYESTNPNDQSAAFLYAAALVGARQSAAAAPILKTNPIPPAQPAVTFEGLYFPALFVWRGDEAAFKKLGGTQARAK